MKFKLIENINGGHDDVSSDDALNEELLLEYRGQTELKEVIVQALNEQTYFNIDFDDYCIHHLNDDHNNMSPSNISITSINNHNSMTNLIRECNWKELSNKLQQCFTIKLIVQPITQEQINNNIKYFKSNVKLYIDDNKTKWRVTPDTVFDYVATAINNHKKLNKIEYGFNSDSELQQHIKDNNWKLIK